MFSRAFDFALAGSKGVKVLPDLTTLPAVGDVGATLYVSRGAGTWAAIAGV